MCNNSSLINIDPTSQICRTAQKKLPKKCLNFVKELETEMGAKVFLLVGYNDMNGDPNSSRYVFCEGLSNKY